MATVNSQLRFFKTAAARSHVRLIKFPERIPLEKRFPMLEKLKNMIIEKTPVRALPRETQAEIFPEFLTKSNGVVVETVDELPERYRRPRISLEEIFYIEQGGPD